MQTVCAIILDYFGNDKTIACLSSLIDQGLETVIVVDNSGNQQSNSKLSDALAAFRQNKVPFVIHQIVNQQNLGFARGVNNALRWLENNRPHRYYLLMNNDAVATPGMLEKLLTFMREHEGTVLSSPVIDTGNKKIDYIWYHRLSGLMFSNNIPGSFPYLSGCCLLVDKRIINNGLFDEDFFMYGEDVALCWRLKMSGYEISCVDGAIVEHEITGSSRQGGSFYEYHMVRGHMLLARKLARYQWETPFLVGGRLLTLSARAIVRSIRFRSWIPVQASLKALLRRKVAY